MLCYLKTTAFPDKIFGEHQNIC